MGLRARAPSARTELCYKPVHALYSTNEFNFLTWDTEFKSLPLDMPPITPLSLLYGDLLVINMARTLCASY